MPTEDSVKDEKRKLTAEELGKLQVKTNEIAKRIEKGSISYNEVLVEMQNIIEGKTQRLKSKRIAKNNECWEIGGVIYFKVTSDGSNGLQWIKRLQKLGIELTRSAEELLKSEEFKFTSNVTYEIAVLKSDMFTDSSRISVNIRNEAKRRELRTPNTEVACLIREMFSNSEIKYMGFERIVIMHELIKDYNGFVSLLEVSPGVNANWLTTHHDIPGNHWLGDWGLAFEVSQTEVL